MRYRISLAVLVTALVSPLAEAQVQYRVNDPGRWRPWQFTLTSSARLDFGASAAELQAFEARLVELGRILKRAPVVAQPVGFAVGTHGYVASYSATPPGYPPGRAVPIAGGFGFGAFALFELSQGGKTVPQEAIATELLYFEVNQILPITYSASKPTEWGPLDPGGFIEPLTGASFAGLPRFGNMFVIKNNPKPLWVPFPLGAALEPVVTLRRDEFESRRGHYEKQVADFETWAAARPRTGLPLTSRDQTALMFPIILLYGDRSSLIADPATMAIEVSQTEHPQPSSGPMRDLARTRLNRRCN